MAEAKPETEMSQEEPKELPLPLHDVIEKWHEHLPLPATLQNRSLSGDGNVALEANARLAEVYVDDLEKVNLSIIGADVVLPPGIKFTITPSITIDRTTKTWTIAETNPLAVSALGTPIGKFRLQDHVLTFEWAQKLRSARLKYCRLQIDAENAQGKQTAKCSLTEPIEQEPLRLKFDNKVHKTELQIDPRSLPDSKHLRMEIQVRGIDEDRLTVSPQTPFELTSNEDSTEPNSRVTIVFFDPEEVEQTEAGDGQKPKKEKLIQVEARVVERANEPPVFFIKNFVYPTLITPKENVTPDFPPLVIATPPQPVEFARNSKESAERQVLIIQSKIKKWRPALAKVTSELVDKLDRAKAAGPKFKAEQDTAQRDLDEATKRKRNYEDAMAETEQFDEWFSHLESVYGDLEEKIEIDFRLYIAVDGVETDILKSRSPGGDIPQPEEAESSSLQSIQDKGF